MGVDVADDEIVPCGYYITLFTVIIIGPNLISSRRRGFKG